MTDHSAERTRRSYSFGPFLLVPEQQLLVEGEKRVRIGSRALDVLTALVERSGQVVEKRDLISRAWPGVTVDEANLKVNMGLLRRALGESAGPPRYIATVVGRGYRFIAPVASAGLETTENPERVQPERNHNLPVGTANVVGRAESIASISQDLGTTRLVSIVGVGGVGKTTVAIAVAEGMVGRFRDGVWFVDLASLKDEDRVPDAIAASVGLAAHSSNMMASLCAAVRDHEVLLVLDNCEHMIEAVALCVDRLLACSKGVNILATSREPLGVRGERVRRLAGLEVPPVSLTTADEALAYPAVQLFVDHAADRSALFQLRDHDVPVIVDICKKLDGVALAIELAATRIDTFTLPELLERLDDRFRLLQGRRAGPTRHRSLLAAMDWSYDLLPYSQQALMQRLSMFSAPFSLGAACAVGIGANMDEIQVIEDLANLVAKSLISVEAQDGEMNYRMLDSTRAYALEKLSKSGDLRRVSSRHAKYALELAEQAVVDSASLNPVDWRNRYTPKIDDIRNALTFAFSDPGDRSTGIRLTIAAIPWWERLSLLDECRLAVSRALDDRYAQDRTKREELLLLLSLGAAQLFVQGPLQEVKQAFTKALEIAEAIKDLDLQMECLRGLSQFGLWSGDARSSLSIAARMREIAYNQEDTTAASADAQAGSALQYLGDLATARKHLESFLASPTSRQVRSDATRFEFDQRIEVRGSLAMVLWLQGYSDQALEAARQQRQEAEESAHAVPRCAAILLTYVCITVYVGDYDETERMLDFADQYSAEHGLILWKAVSECMRVKLHLETGRPIDLGSYESALAEVRSGGLGLRYAPFVANYGHVLSQRGDAQGAISRIDEAIALYGDSGQDWGLPEMLSMKGNFLLAGGGAAALQAAADCYKRAIALARQHGSLTWELRSATQLAQMSLTFGGYPEAMELLISAYEKFQEGFWTADLQRAKALLGEL
ncbi:ATP-binding protein [Rhizobium leguminosarum]|uniref:ATP-binding protein n=1 Tax=Rhizobium leguminosarum TaxID=384 RepID=UPI001FE0112B|nr:winged helix-turn-helix domain-containing protein [Rhizobium leguminosarum]